MLLHLWTPKSPKVETKFNSRWRKDFPMLAWHWWMLEWKICESQNLFDSQQQNLALQQLSNCLFFLSQQHKRQLSRIIWVFTFSSTHIIEPKFNWIKKLKKWGNNLNFGQKMSHLNYSILAFSNIFCPFKVPCLLTLFDSKLQFSAFLINSCPL